MKVSTTVIKTLLLSLVIAFTGHVLATPEPWFSGTAVGNEFIGVNADWDTSEATGVGDVTVTNNVLEIDLPTSTVVKLTPDSNDSAEKTRTCVVVDDAVFTPTSVEDIDNSVVEGSQTALTVAYENSSTNYYAYITNKWVKLEGATPSASEVDVTVVLDYSVSTQTNVMFKVDGNTLWYGEQSNTNFPITSSSRCLSHIDLAGYGKLHSITSTVEIVADVTINPTNITYGADFTNVTVKAAVTSTAEGTTDYWLTWDAGTPVRGTVVDGTVTFANVQIDAPSSAYQSVNYTITAKVGGIQIGATEEIPAKIADVRDWIDESEDTTGTTGTWLDGPIPYNDHVATLTGEQTFKATNCSTGDLVKITFSNIVYAELSDLEVATPEGTQGAFALAETNDNNVVSTNFFVLTKPADTYVWVPADCSVVANTNISYTVEMSFNYTNNTYSVAVRDAASNFAKLSVNQQTEFSICTNKTAVTDFVFKGNGTLSSIMGVESTGYMAKDANDNYWVKIQEAVTRGTGPFTILRATDTNAKYNGWKFDNSDGVWKLVRAAVGMFFFAF